MTVKLLGKKNWATTRVETNDFYRDTVERTLSDWASNNGVSTQDHDFNIIDITNTSMNTGDYVIITFTYDKKPELNIQ